jgi:hypothetical protein
MSHSFQFTEKVVIGGVSTQQVNTLTAGLRIAISESISIANDVLVALSVDVSQVKGVYILSDQALTLETNSSGSPTNTLTLVANIPYIWYTGKYDTLKFTSDITALYVTNASASAANLTIEILTDPTV